MLEAGSGRAYEFLRPLGILPHRPSPQVECSVAAPRAPRLGDLIRAGSGHSAEVVAEDDVLPGERVRPAQRAHCDVMRSPASYSGQRDELLHGCIRIRAGVELQTPGRNLGRERKDSAGARLNDAERGDVIYGKSGNALR